MDTLQFVEDYIIENNVQNIALYTNPDTIPDFDDYLVQKHRSYTKELMKYKKRPTFYEINLKTYSLYRDIRFVNLRFVPIITSFMVSFGALTEMIYEHKNKRSNIAYQYDILKLKYNTLVFCKRIMVFLNSIAKVLNQPSDCKTYESSQKYFCLHDCTSKSSEHVCVSRCKLTPNEIEYLRTIRQLANSTRIYPAIVDNSEDLQLFVPRTFENANEIIIGGRLHWIMNYGSMTEIYDKIYIILLRIMFNLFGKCATINPNIIELCKRLK